LFLSAVDDNDQPLNTELIFEDISAEKVN